MQLLKEIPRSRAEWIFWVDMDIIIDRMDFQIPVSAYDGKDFVIWGRRDKISEGDVLNGEPYIGLQNCKSCWFQQSSDVF